MDEALTKPRNVTHTMYKLYNWLQMGMIDLNPEFQRDIVWTGIKQSHLVDSVLNNFYVPPIIFSCKKLDSKRWMRVCIDGKQRLTAIRKFMDNEIPHLSPSDGNITKRYYRNLNNRRSLTEAEREMFDCSELLCVEYYDLTLHQEQEIFSRVQLGVALTPAEKLQAISSPMADFAHTIYSQHSTLSSIMDNKRARPFQLITQSLHMIETEPEKFNATPATITKYLKEDREVPEGLKALAKQIYTTIEEMIEDDAELFHRDHRLAPVEFVFLTYMIAKYPKLPIFQYQNRLLAMKKHVRAKHDDIRFNNKVFDTLKKFVDNMEYEFISNHQTISYTPSSHHTNHTNHSNHSSHSNNSVTYPLPANTVYDTPSSSTTTRGKKRVKTSN